jgi:flavin-binding protein dodecin
MSSIYKVIEIIGGSEKSWEDAAQKAVETAAKSLKEMRIAEVKELDMRVEEGKVVDTADPTIFGSGESGIFFVM